jgi:hypothetical protein
MTQKVSRYTSIHHKEFFTIIIYNVINALRDSYQVYAIKINFSYEVPRTGSNFGTYVKNNKAEFFS